VIGNLLVIQLPHASDRGMITLPSSPIDCFALRLESLQHMVRMVLDHLILDVAAFRSAFWTPFDVDVSHDFSLGAASRATCVP
jgi:hypothetical protein